MIIRIPAEWEPHACCWMAWAVHREWDKGTANHIKRELSEVVQTIARYEPVRVLAGGARLEPIDLNAPPFSISTMYVRLLEARPGPWRRRMAGGSWMHEVLEPRQRLLGQSALDPSEFRSHHRGP